jgi:hypothetical protein
MLGCSRGSSRLAAPTFEDNVEYNEDPQAKAVRECFASYKNAMSAGTVESALKLTDSSTLPWFKTAVESARSLKRAELSELDMATRLFVLYMRQKYSANELRDMDADKAFKVYIADWTGDLPRTELGIIHFEQNDTALAMPRGQFIQYFWAFAMDGKDWKVRFKASMDLYGEALVAVARSQNKSEDELLVESLSAHTGKPVDKRIFDGPRE